MDLTPYVASLGRELLTAAETGDGDAGALIERLTVSMESAIRLTLLEALSAAADEITRDLAPGSVQVHLRGRDPNFVVTARQTQQPLHDTPEPGAVSGAVSADDAAASFEDGPVARINVRLPEQLKAAIEEAAGKEGRSLNAWLVRAASTALRAAPHAPERDHGSGPRGKRSAQRYTGWAR
ncbi:type II toxin-antitoxin system HicB family antitoxin [Streptosporangium sp. NBC_01755]|uniref:toxin-antitoxin system HicB family antitoxin n=1 Tax=unclassified Streptosporangium TaxID=2632669 RepID=UPI002DD87D89|nr:MULTISPECIES: toxin-antitoxin system HicB family antitoxin [unclassified Streptosporangium]WSA28664.1 type II toxin-antitoxin system HicB family antitoxin [Streptosporangium sp. NBC_01810]WSC99884.1 type II toxin-antitoxin system HicB family antitoxin [Streptosporangium sp. NBC_01755]